MLLSECGLDPGLDHMLAMEVIDKVIAKGGEVCFVLLSWKVKISETASTLNTILPSQ